MAQVSTPLKSKRTFWLFAISLFAAVHAFGQITEFKKLLPVENAPGYNYGNKVTFSGGLGIIRASGFSTNAILSGFTSFSYGQVYVVQRDSEQRWKLIGSYTKAPLLTDDAAIIFGSYSATDGTNVAIGQFSGAQGLMGPVLDIYEVQSEGQISFVKELQYTFGGDYSPWITNDKYPIAMASGMLVAGNPYDVNRDPNDGTPISDGRLLIYGKHQGGLNNWGLVKVLEAPPPFGTLYGSSVSMTGTHIVTGGPSSNAIYLYAKDLGGANNWGFVKQIASFDAASGDAFGYAVSISSDILVVGAPNDDDRGTDSGAIYIYAKDQGGTGNWGLVKKIAPTDGSAGDQFGYSISVVNGDLAVGAPQDDDNGSNSGSMYHFSKDLGGANNWGLVSKIIKAPGTYTDDLLGQSLAIDGDQLLTGLPYEDLQGTNSGAVSLYQKNSGAFEFSYQWSVARVMGGDFGGSVSLTSDYASSNANFIFSRDNPVPNGWGVISGGNYTNSYTDPIDFHMEGDLGFKASYHPPMNSCCDGPTGSVVVLGKDQGGTNNWGVVKTVTLTDPADESIFAMKSATSGETLVANAYSVAYGFTDYEYTTKGEVFVFSKNNGGTNNWGKVKKLTAPVPQDNDQFGYDLTVQNEVLGISAPGFLNFTGGVFIHYQNRGGTNNWGLLKRIDTPDGTLNDEFGKAIQLHGNNLVVAAPGHSANAGAVYFFSKDQGGTDMWGLVRKISAPISNPGGKFGMNVALSGEALLVSNNAREVFLFLVNEGGTSNWGYAGKLLSSDYVSGDQFGASFSISDNMILVGAPAQSNALGTNIGAAYLFYTPPPSPIVNAATGITNSSFSVSWNAVSGVSGYKVDVSTVADFSSFVTGYNGFSTTATTVSVSTLAANQSYYVRVRSVKTQGGDSKFSNSVTALTAPAAPVAAAGTAITSGSFTASWSAPAGATSYTVELLNDEDSSVAGFPKVVNTASTNVTGLTSGKAYKYRVTASNGNSSPSSNQVTVLLLPLPPALVVQNGSLTQTSATLTWSAVTGASEYFVDLSTDNFVTFVSGYENKAVGNVTSLAITGLSNATSYKARARAANASGVSLHATSVDILTIPGTPVLQSATSPTSTSFTLNWSPVAGASNFRLDVSSDNFANLISGYNNLLVASTNTFTGAGLAPATSYQVRIRSENASGVSPNSNALTVVTLTTEPIAQPTSLVFSNVATNSFSSSFTNATGSSSGYLVLYKSGSSPTEIPVDGTPYTAGAAIGTSTVAYAGSLNSFSLSGLSANTVYYFDVFAYSGANQTINYLSTNPLEGSRSTLATEPTAQPTNFTFSSISTSGFLVNFTAASGAPTGYLVLRKPATAVEETPVDGVGYTAGTAMGTSAVVYAGPNTTFTEAALSPGVAYFYAIFSFNGTTNSYNYLTTAPLAASTVTLPSAPVATQASNTTSTSFTANWDPATGAISYEVDVSKDDFATLLTGFPKTGLTNTELTVADLTAQTSYKYRIRAVNSNGGKSANSNVITAITSDAPANALKINTTSTVSTFVAPNPVKLLVNVSGGTGTKTVTLKHRGILATTSPASKPAVLKSGDDYEVEITDSMLDDLGLEYYFEATDQLGTIKQNSNSYVYRSVAASAASIPFAKGFNGTTSTYQMFSIPYELADNDINKLFDVALGGQDKTQWRLYHYANKENKEYPNQFLEIKVGEGYWFNTIKPDFKIQLGIATVVQKNQDTAFEFNLASGWNQIGNPYPFNISWEDVAGANDQVDDLNFWVNGKYSEKDVFKPWEGAFVFNSSTSAVTLAVPLSAKTTGGRTRQELPASLDNDRWKLNLQITIAEFEQQSGIGMHPDAHSSKDMFDKVALPRFMDYVEMNVTHPEFFAPKFATDVVPTREEQTWLFDIQSNLEGEMVEVKWDHLAISQAASTLVLIDLLDQTWVDMKTTGVYRFQHQPGRQLKIVYNRKGEMNPGITLLGTPYPNPFSNEVTLPVLVDKQNTTLQVEIFDMMGRRIRTLTETFSKPGMQSLHWNGRDDTGEEVSNGMLLYRMAAGQSGPVKRMLKQ